MPWITVRCDARCGCGKSRRMYHAPSQRPPKFIGRDHIRINRPPGLRPANLRYVFTPVMDAALRRAWLTATRGQRVAAAIREAPELAAFPRHALTHRTRTLGLAGVDDARWSPAEDAILEQLAGEYSAETIRRRLRAAGFERGLAGIAQRLNRRYQRSVRGREVSAQDVARLLGWEQHVVIDWIKAGKLRAAKGRRLWRIHPRDLAAFVRAEAGMLSARRVDLLRLVELLDAYTETDRPHGRPRNSEAAREAGRRESARARAV